MEIHIKCLIQACINQNIKYKSIDIEQNFINVALAGGLLFQNNRTSFNSEVMASICKDKEHAYQLLHDLVSMPKTIGFLDFNTHDHYQKYVKHTSLESIMDKIEQEFNFPVVIKKNSGALGSNVFLCQNKKQIEIALNNIFNQNSHNYDYIALAQEYIRPQQEFRAVFFRNELLLCYQRISENKEFGLRYWDTNKGHALHIDNQEELSILTRFVQPALELPGLNYVGFDIIKDWHDKYWLLEMNSGPKYDHYIQSYGEQEIITLFEKILYKEKEIMTYNNILL